MNKKWKKCILEPQFAHEFLLLKVNTRGREIHLQSHVFFAKIKSQKYFNVWHKIQSNACLGAQNSPKYLLFETIKFFV